jgi:hypothetical protein
MTQAGAQTISLTTLPKQQSAALDGWLPQRSKQGSRLIGPDR